MSEFLSTDQWALAAPARQEGRERQGELASGPSTHLSTQHGVGSSDTHRNRLNLLFPPPPVHYYGPPHRACSSPLTRSLVLVLSLSVALRSSSLFVILPLLSIFFFLNQISPSLYICCFFFYFISQQCSVISLLTVSSQRSFFWLKLKICATNRKMVLLEEEGDHQTGCFNQCEGERSGRLNAEVKKKKKRLLMNCL